MFDKNAWQYTQRETEVRNSSTLLSLEPQTFSLVLHLEVWHVSFSACVPHCAAHTYGNPLKVLGQCEESPKL